MNPAQLLERRAAEHPDRPAVLHNKLRLTYSELADQTKRLAGTFRQLGLEPGSRVAVLLGNCPEWVSTYLACAWSGTVIAPVDLRLQVPEVAALLEDLDPQAVVAGPDMNDNLAQVVEKTASQAVRILSGARRDGWHSFEDILSNGPEMPEPTDTSEEQLSAILYTSGTTGLPRGAMLPFRVWDTFQISLEDLYSPPSDRVWMLFAPISHISGPLYCNATLYFRCPLLLIDCFRPSAFLSAVAEHRPYITSVAPPVLAMVLSAAEGKQVDFSCFGLLAAFGAPTPPDLRRRFEERFGVKLQTGYGLTEVAPLISMTPPEIGMSRAYCVGKITRGVRVKIIDDDGNELSTDEIGEIVVSGPNVMTGYWRQPEMTQEVLRDGWFYTGDLGRIDEDGLLYVVGRKKDMIIVAGANVYAAEVENVLIHHPDVEQVAVVGVSDELRGEVVKAFVVLRRGAQTTATDLAEFARRYLASYKVPRVFEFRDALPLTRTGKIDKRQLQEKPLYEEWVL